MKGYKYEIGDKVIDVIYGYKGTIIARYSTYDKSNNSQSWLKGLKVQPSKKDLNSPWYDISCVTGGAISAWESKLQIK